MPEAKERLREDNLDVAEGKAYKRYLKNRQYEISILETTKAAAELVGWKRGRQDEKLSIARAMKEAGSSLEFIAQVTGLSLENLE